MKGNNIQLHLRISRHNIFTRFPLLFNYFERSCAYICRKRKLFLLLFMNVVSHSRSFFLLAHCRTSTFLCLVSTVLYVSLYILWSPLITERVRLRPDHVRTLFTSSDFYAVTWTSRPAFPRKIFWNVLPKSCHLQPRISYFSRHISVNGLDYLCGLPYFLT